MPGPGRLAETREWFAKAALDLRAAEFEFTAVPPLTADIVFHCQQLAEQTGSAPSVLERWGQATLRPADAQVFWYYTALNNNVVYSCKYHVMWCPKYRCAVLVTGIDVRLKEIIQTVCSESSAEILALDVMPEHVHLLVEVAPQYGIHRLVHAIKGRSSRLLRQEYPWLKSRLPTLWTSAYFVSTVGGAPLEVSTQCIDNQKWV
jgi:putative transposase